MGEITNTKGFKNSHLFALIAVVAVFVAVAVKVVDHTRCPEKGFAVAEHMRDGKQIYENSFRDSGEWSSPQIPLKNRGTPLGKDGVKIFNSVSYRDCSIELKWRAVVRYVEIRDSRLSALIDRRNRLVGKQGEYFRRAKFSENREKNDTGREGFWAKFTDKLADVHPQGVFPRPKWIPVNAFSNATFIGFLGHGWLFKGQVEHQFYWVASM